jgi:protein ImuA
LIDGLRQRIRAIERHAPISCGSPPEASASLWSPNTWTLGADEIDARIGARGLDGASLHEVKPQGGGGREQAAALSFTLRLAVRRLQSIAAGQGRPTHKCILWCWPERAAREAGRLYGPGLAALGLDASAILIVETARASEALWALEEGLKSGSLALAVGVLPEIALTPARRLALAAAEYATPALLVTDARAGVMAATATRWRTVPERSAPHPFDPEAPGGARLAVTLERCRGRPESEMLSSVLEWCDETHRFRMASPVAHRAPASQSGARRPARRRTG